MTVALFWLLALLEIVIGAGVFASAESSVHEVLGVNLIGFGILTLAFARLLSELRKTRREAAKERRAASEERQARAALDLKRRSGMISAMDRQQMQIGTPDSAAAVNSGAARPSGKPDSKAGSTLAHLHFDSAQFHNTSSKRRWNLLTSCAIGDVSGLPSNPQAFPFDRGKARSRSDRNAGSLSIVDFKAESLQGLFQG